RGSRLRAGLISVCLLCAGSALPSPPSGFEPIGSKHGVAVYRRHGPIAIDVLAEGEMASAPERIRDVLLDFVNQPRFIKQLTVSPILSRGPSSLLVYQRLDLPLIADRDFTLLVTWGETGQDLWIRFACANQLGPPPVRGVVRVNVHEGEWRMQPVAPWEP